MIKKTTSIITMFLCIIFLSTNAFGQAEQKIEKDIKNNKRLVEKLDFSKNEFSIDTRFGLSNITGNNISLTLNFANKTKYRIKRFENRWLLGAYYERLFSTTDADDKPETQTRYIFGLYRLDYYVSNKHSLFIGGGGYTDKVKSVDVAGRGFTGIRFIMIRTPKTGLDMSFGYNFTHENKTAPNPTKNFHMALQQVSFTQKISDILVFSQSIEALEDVRDAHEMRINANTELRIGVSKHFGFVLGVLIKFDNEPSAGDKKLDTYTTLALSVLY